ncbi:MAG: substrate-binding domain-containing protein [Geminicoccaceae bacterium]
MVSLMMTGGAARAAYEFPSEDAARETIGDIVEVLVADRQVPDPCDVHIVPDIRSDGILAPDVIDLIDDQARVALEASALGEDCTITSVLSSGLELSDRSVEGVIAHFREQEMRGLVLSIIYYDPPEGAVMMGRLEDIHQGFISGSDLRPLPNGDTWAGAESDQSSTNDPPANGAGGPLSNVKTFTVYFELGGVSLDDAGRQAVRQAAAYAEQVGDAEIYVEGHTDTSGSREINERVAAARAKSVLDALLTEAGIQADKVRVVHFGEDRPVIATGADVRESSNRRAEITVAPATNTLRIGGTGLALGGIRTLAEAFITENPRADIEIPPSLGSGGGIKALLADAIDLSVSTRPPKDKEAAKGATAFRYGRTPFVFATRPDTGVNGVTTQQLADLYGGQVTTWPNGSDVHLVLRPPGRSTNKTLKNMSAAMSDAIDATLARPGVVPATTDQDSADAIEQQAGALGTTTLGMILAEGRELQPLALDGVEPTIDNLAAERYPLERSLYLVLGPKPNRLEEAFAAFIKWAQGRDILNSIGYLVDGQSDTIGQEQQPSTGAWLAPGNKVSIGETIDTDDPEGPVVGAPESWRAEGVAPDVQR